METYSTYSEDSLRDELEESLLLQGYTLKDNTFFLSELDRDSKRNAHKLARMDRLAAHINILKKNFSKIEKLTPQLEDIDVSKISPKLIELKGTGNSLSNLFLWWNLVWWSLPYEKAYGRQIRYLVWDDYHNAPIGLIGLQSPILKWKPRDSYLNLESENLDYWVNQSLNAQRLGALPPYNKLLGGKLVASLIVSNELRELFYKKYANRETELLKRKIPSNLLFVTTTGAFGKSSIYNRLKNDEKRLICKKIGDTQGSGTFHIPHSIYEGLIGYLKEKELYTGRYFGSGPSKRIKNIDVALKALGYKKGVDHGIKRSIYLFEMVSNILGVIHQGEEPNWITQEVEQISNHWKSRWALKRVRNAPAEKLIWNKDAYFSEVYCEIEQAEKLLKI